MTGLLKVFLLGTFVSVALALFALVDSVGGLMYEQGRDVRDCWTPSETAPPRAPVGGCPRNKGIGS